MQVSKYHFILLLGVKPYFVQPTTFHINTLFISFIYVRSCMCLFCNLRMNTWITWKVLAISKFFSIEGGTHEAADFAFPLLSYFTKCSSVLLAFFIGKTVARMYKFYSYKSNNGITYHSKTVISRIMYVICSRLFKTKNVL